MHARYAQFTMLMCFSFHVSTVVSPRVESAFRRFAYVPYPLLAPQHGPTSGAQSAHQEVLFTASGITVPALEDPREDCIAQVEWLSASILAERFWGRLWPRRLADLTRHHRVVLEITATWGWPVARRYDIYQRKSLAETPTIDVSLRNDYLITNISAKLALQAQEAAAAASIAAASALAAAASHRSAPTTPTRKRTHDFDASPRTSPKRHEPSADSEPAKRCFRCGHAGHIVVGCSNKTTVAGKAVAELAPAQSARSPNALVAKDGRVYCFKWASGSACAAGGQCPNVHACSICEATTHGAGRCTVATQRS